MSREEFLALCWKCAGLAPADPDETAAFADGDAVSAWARGYVAAAARRGRRSCQKIRRDPDAARTDGD